MKKIYLGLICILQSYIGSSQVLFQSGYGDTAKDVGTVILKTADGGYTIVGSTGSNMTDSSDIGIYHLDVIGDLVWSYKIGLSKDDVPTGMVETPDSGYLVVGTTWSSPLDPGHTDIFAVKISDQGSVEWSKVYGGNNTDEANAVITTPEGNFLIVGSTMSFGGVTRSALALKINDTGEEIWCNVSNAAADNFYKSADITFDEKYILAGGSDVGNDFDHYVVKMDTNGSILWGQRHATAGADWLNNIILTGDRGYVAVGISSGNSAGDTDGTVLKMDTSGNVTWAFNYGTPEYDRLVGVLENSSNHYVVCGTTFISAVAQMVIDEIDNTGNIIWANSYGLASETCEGTTIIQGYTQGYAATGNSVSFGDANGDAILVKTDDIGMTGCAEASISLTQNQTALTSTLGATGQLVVLDSFVVTMTNTNFINQYAQNCFSDKIHEILNSELVKLYPNPARNSIQIETQMGKAVATIVDTFGQTVSHHNLTSNKSTVDITSLAAGTYFIEVKAENKFARVMFVKQ